MRKRVAESVVLAALGHALRDAVLVILVLRRAVGLFVRERPVRADRHELAAPHRRQARIGKHQWRLAPPVRLVGPTPDGRDRVVGGDVPDRDFGAQFIEHQAVRQGRCLVPRRLQAEPLRRAHHEEIEQDLALRGQHPGVERALGFQQLHVVGDNALQQLLGVLARHADDATIGKERYSGVGHVSPLRLQGASVLRMRAGSRKQAAEEEWLRPSISC